MKVTTSESGEKGARQFTVDYEFGNNLEEVVGIFGEPVVYNHVTASFKIALQGFIRRLLKLKSPEAEIKEKVKGWKPGMKKEGKSPAEKAKDAFGKLSEEERKALLKDLKAGNV